MTPEQNQLDADSLLRSLVETSAGERIRMKCGVADLRSVITDLLSLVKGQEVGDFNEAAETIVRESVNALDYDCGGSDGDCGELCEHWEVQTANRIKSALESIATSMRSACVEKVRACAAIYAENDSEAGRWMSVAAADIIAALEASATEKEGMNGSD